MTKYSPAKTGEYQRMFPDFRNCSFLETDNLLVQEISIPPPWTGFFLSPHPHPLRKFQLSFIHFFKFFGRTEPPTPLETLELRNDSGQIFSCRMEVIVYYYYCCVYNLDVYLKRVLGEVIMYRGPFPWFWVGVRYLSKVPFI